jgi:hypothetical protein
VDERSPVITVPTELDRRTPFWDFVALALSIATIWYLIQNGYSWWWAVPIVLCVGSWSLTGEPACDVSGVGAIASGLRSKLGMRRIHEWLMAYGHYVHVVIWPRSREQWQNSRLRSAMARTLTRCPRLPHVSGARWSSRLPHFWSKP